MNTVFKKCGRSTLQALWAAAIFACGVSSEAHAQDNTFLVLKSDPGDPVGGGQTLTFTLADSQFHPWTGGGMDVASGSTDWAFRFAAPGYAPLTPGMYEGAVDWFTFYPRRPKFSVQESLHSCSAVTGRFTVLEMQMDAGGMYSHFAVDFEQHCGGGKPALRGSLRFHSTFDATPRLNVGSVMGFEGNDATSTLSAVISLSRAAPVPVQVQYSTVDGTAHAGVDYTPVSGTVTIPAAATEAVLSIPILANAVSDPDRDFSVVLGGAQGAPIAFGTGVVTILDDDPVPTRLTIDSQPGDYVGAGQHFTVTELDGFFSTLQGPPGEVGLSFRGGTFWDATFLPPVGRALTPGTYEAPPPGYGPSPTTGWLRFGGDGRGCNGTGRFVVLEAEYAADGSATKLAIDFEQRCYYSTAPALYGSLRYRSTVPSALRVSTGAASVYEGNGEPRALRFPISLSAPSPSPVSVSYRTVAGTAVPGTDFTPANGTYTFAPGQTSGFIDVPVHGNLTPEPDRTLTLLLEDPSGAILAFAEGAGTIADDDALRTLLYVDSDPGDWIGGGALQLLRPLDDGFLPTQPQFGQVEVYLASQSGWLLDFAALSGSPLVPGLYDGATRYPMQVGTPGLSVAAENRGCNSLTGRFLVLEASYGAGDAVNAFAADFEQHCEWPDAPALFGSIRVNSDIPPSPRLVTKASFHTLNPCRLVDTRDTQTPLLNGTTRVVHVAGSCGIPLTARTIAANVTAVYPSAAGVIHASAPGLVSSDASVVSFAPGKVRAGFAVLPVNVGVLTLAVEATDSGPVSTDVIVDVSGYFE